MPFLSRNLLRIPNLPKSSEVKLHAMAFIAVALNSRVTIQEEQVTALKTCCQQYFTAHCLFLAEVNPTVWTIGYAIPYPTDQLCKESGYGLGLNSMQGCEAKHIKLARYVENTCNIHKHWRWWTVFRHEYISLVWLRELDPLSINYRCEKKKSWVTPTFPRDLLQLKIHYTAFVDFKNQPLLMMHAPFVQAA